MPENDATARPPARAGGTVMMAEPRRLAGIGIRVLSAIIMAPVALATVFLGGWWLAVLVIVVGTYGNLEWNRITRTDHFVIQSLSGLSITSAVTLLMIMTPEVGISVLALGGALVGILAAKICRSAAWPIIGLVYVGGAVLGFLWIRQAYGSEVVFWLLFLIWATDVGAYITGSLVGGPKLVPRLSPKKTWSGLVGGSVAAALISTLFGIWVGLGSVNWLIPAGLVLACWSQLGDIVESMIKRRFNVKDSGQIIPGHGGVLDRIDGLLFTIPVVVLALIFLPGFSGAAHG